MTGGCQREMKGVQGATDHQLRLLRRMSILLVTV